MSGEAERRDDEVDETLIDETHAKDKAMLPVLEATLRRLAEKPT